MIVIKFYQIIVSRRSTVQARWVFQGEPSPVFKEDRPGKIIGYQGLDAYGVQCRRKARYPRNSTFEVKFLGEANSPLYPIRQRLTFPETKRKLPRVVVALTLTVKGWRYLTRIEGSETENYELEMHFGGERWAYEYQMEQPSAVTLLD